MNRSASWNLFDANSRPVAIAGTNLVIENVNPAWRTTFGALPADRKLTITDLLQAQAALHFDQNEDLTRGFYQLCCLSNEMRWYEAELVSLDEHVLVLLADAQDRVINLLEQSRLQKMRDLLMRNASIGTWRYDPDTEEFEFPNVLFELAPDSVGGALTGRSIFLAGREAFAYVHPDDAINQANAMERVSRNGGMDEYEVRIRKPEGWNHVKLLIQSGIRLPSGLYEVFGLMQTITDLALARDAAQVQAELITSLANTDSLTGLSNRMAFDERLRMAVAVSQRKHGSFALIYIDLDLFKEVNDTLGHAAGDELLSEVARRLLTVGRAEDTIARLGGDEFAIIQSGANPSNAAILAQHVMQQLSGPVTLEAGHILLSCSMGITLIRQDGMDQAAALREADLALYRAKAQGRGSYCFYEAEMDVAVRAKMLLASEFSVAVAEGALTVVYQPIVHSDGRVVAVEAMSRWMHPSRGAIPPSVFIPLAEERGLISRLGDAVWRRCCEDLLDWPALRVSVNMSVAEIGDACVLDRIRAVVAQTGINPGRFDIELTESCLLQDDVRSQETLAALRKMGFQLSLDDFGTGYSSLSYLNRYPIDKLKLDRSFVSGLGESGDSFAIVNAIVQLAHKLRLKIIAEGVETREQLQMLTEMGVDFFQGFLFSRPLLVSELRRYLDMDQPSFISSDRVQHSTPDL